MHYYKIYDKDYNFLGVATSLHLRYYNPDSKRILCCREDQAQYIRFNEILYRIYWFDDECVENIGKYPDANLRLATKEEYEKYMAEMDKVKSE